MWRYWADPSTDVICIAWCDGNGPVHTWRKGEPLPPALGAAITSRAPLAAHNAQFERLAFKWLARRYGWPKVRDDQWHCTAAQAAALALPRALERACAAVGAEQQKDPAGKALIKRLCLPQRDGTRIMPADDPEAFDTLVRYCQQDVNAERVLHGMLPKLPADEQKVWLLDTLINDRGMPLDRDLIYAMAEMSEVLTGDLHTRAKALTGGLAPTQRDRLLAWVEDEGSDITSLKRAEVERALANPRTPPNVRELLQIRLEAARVSVKKLQAALACANADGRVRGMLLYHGATTGRWAGRLLQPHNFPRGVLSHRAYDDAIDIVLNRDVDALRLLYDNPMAVLSSIMRAIISAGTGKVLNIADYSAIEARALVWLAGQADIVALYRKDADLYRHMASKIFNVPVADVTDEQRKYGKDTVLGCGYSMGVDAFIRTGQARNITITRDLAEACVYGYRDAYKRVPMLWRNMELAAIGAVQTGRRTVAGQCTWYTQDRFLFCELPSGRRLAYPDPTIVHDDRFNKPSLTFMGESKRQWVTQRTYGGKLVENVVQAVSRDIMAHGMRTAEERGMPVIGTVHDEVLTEEPINKADARALEAALCSPPPWAVECPINAKGFISKRYRKG
jgi:DNA polymerase